jgi:hypothetical protein
MLLLLSTAAAAAAAGAAAVIMCRAGEPPDMTPHAEWLRQGELFNVLKQLPFFKQQRLRMVSSSCCLQGAQINAVFLSLSSQLVTHRKVQLCVV